MDKRRNRLYDILILIYSYIHCRYYNNRSILSKISKKKTVEGDGIKMRKVMYTSARIRDTLITRINEILEKNSTAELVAVVERNKLFTAFIQYETDG